ncbi:VanZ family protein [Paenibacillus sp. y28]|uniref:VanZ family protein n=1 Tax=Paenibacillus sp. y28 TaxID=3129110 RepID=UPI0030177D8A
MTAMQPDNRLNNNGGRPKGRSKSSSWRFIRWIPAVIMMALIFAASAQSGEQLDTMLPFFQRWFPAMEGFNWGHYVTYFILSICFYFALGSRSWRAKLLSVALCAVYGGTDEIHQLWVPGRMADWLDLRNDTIGAALAMLLLSIPAVDRVYVKMCRIFSRQT